MDGKKNNLIVDMERAYYQELIYARVIVLLVRSREININDVLVFELAAYPLSMFNADAKMNVATSKSTLKHKLQANASEHNCPISDTMIMTCLHFFGLSPGRLANFVSRWTRLRRSSIKIYDALMSSSCFTSATTLRSSRGRRDQDQVASINWHQLCRL